MNADRKQWLAGFAAVAALTAGWAALFGPQAAFPPAQTLDWLPWLLGGSVLLLGLGEGAAFPPALRWPLRVAVLGLGLWLLTPPLLRSQDAASLAVELGGALALGALLMAVALRRGREAGGEEAVTAAFAAAFGGLGFATALGGSLVVGGVTLAAFAIAAVAFLAALSGRAPRPGPAALAAAVGVWVWLAYSARHLAEIPLPETLLSATALGAVLLSPRSPAGGLLRRGLAALLLPALLAAAAAAATAWRYFAAAPSSYY